LKRKNKQFFPPEADQPLAEAFSSAWCLLASIRHQVEAGWYFSAVKSTEIKTSL